MEPVFWLGVVGAAALIVFFFLIFLVKLSETPAM